MIDAAARLALLVVEPAADADALRTQLAASRNAAERALQLHDGPWPELFEKRWPCLERIARIILICRLCKVKPLP